MSSYDVAMDLLRLSDEEFAEVFAWIDKADFDIDKIDKAGIELSKSDMYKTVNLTKRLPGILMEIINDSDCCPSAWWKKTPKQRFLECTPERQQDKLMETAMRIQELYTDLLKAGVINVDSARWDSFNIYEEFCRLAREFEYEYCDTSAYEDDFIGLTETYFIPKLKELFDKEVAS